MSKIVVPLLESNPTVSKRQTELKINELGLKDKEGDETQKTWKLRPEFERYLHMTPEEIEQLDKQAPLESGSSSGGGSSGKSSAKKKKVKDEAAAGDADGAGGKAAAGKAKGASSDKKRKRSAEDDGAGAEAVPPPGEGPKRYKRAFGHFVRAHRTEAEKTVGPVRSFSLLFACG